MRSIVSLSVHVLEQTNMDTLSDTLAARENVSLFSSVYFTAVCVQTGTEPGVSILFLLDSDLMEVRLTSYTCAQLSFTI